MGWGLQGRQETKFGKFLSTYLPQTGWNRSSSSFAIDLPDLLLCYLQLVAPEAGRSAQLSDVPRAQICLENLYSILDTQGILGGLDIYAPCNNRKIFK
jgi:hypothetical protein